MNVKILRSYNFKKDLWSGGSTTEIYIYEENSSYKERNFSFRISSATVELDESNFTLLPNINRIIMTIEGSIEISHDGVNKRKLQPFEPYNFYGGDKTISYGKCVDFNLMLKNGFCGKVYSKEIKGFIDEEVKEGTLFKGIYSLSDRLKIECDGVEYSLGKNDFFVINNENFEKLNFKIYNETQNIHKMIVVEVGKI